jgi:hypothetical protein
MVHVSRSLILPCWSGYTVVSIAVEVLICAWCWSLICMLPGTLISIVPSLTTTVAWSTTPKFCALLFLCGGGGVEWGDWKLGRWIYRCRVWNPWPAACILGCPLCWPGWKLGPCDEEPTWNLVLLPWDPLHCIFLLRSMIPLRFSKISALSTMSWKLVKSRASRALARSSFNLLRN